MPWLAPILGVAAIDSARATVPMSPVPTAIGSSARRDDPGGRLCQGPDDDVDRRAGLLRRFDFLVRIGIVGFGSRHGLLILGRHRLGGDACLRHRLVKLLGLHLLG